MCKKGQARRFGMQAQLFSLNKELKGITTMPNDAGSEMKDRLRADLRTALKERRAMEAKLLRALIAALDNAEAPQAHASKPALQHDFHERSAEVERHLLSSARVQEILLAEIDEREHAAAEFERLQKGDHAEAMRAETRMARRYTE